MVRFMFMDAMFSGLNPPSSFTKIEESRQLSVIPGAGITRCGHIERKDLDTAR